MSQQIHQEVVFEASPERIYQVLTEAGEFSAMSGGAAAQIDATPGGAFSCFGGMIVGRIVECSPGQLLVQAWRAESWDPGVYSVVRFELQPEDGKTRLTLDHSGFPEGQSTHLADGWRANYWEPLKRALAE